MYTHLLKLQIKKILLNILKKGKSNRSKLVMDQSRLNDLQSGRFSEHSKLVPYLDFKKRAMEIMVREILPFVDDLHVQEDFIKTNTKILLYRMFLLKQYFKNNTSVHSNSSLLLLDQAYKLL